MRPAASGGVRLTCANVGAAQNGTAEFGLFQSSTAFPEQNVPLDVGSPLCVSADWRTAGASIVVGTFWKNCYAY